VDYWPLGGRVGPAQNGGGGGGSEENLKKRTLQISSLGVRYRHPKRTPVNTRVSDYGNVASALHIEVIRMFHSSRTGPLANEISLILKLLIKPCLMQAIE
jgi:hypothetical protein